ncbi:SDR family oxidoreductase [Shimwellia pseudoproteus]|uniref:SDR family NAD(P)-dependent oxidoreductase n=1 Tax=Shimwellia pseudoproteus TaxID=570012 RepID=UPI0018EDD9E4|nr:SDR family oxidoreductase [Shimwellia pseudoproteus]MBJ3814958.1 SDR family oxidoreductase [Shimwellia pseudoproteus]
MKNNTTGKKALVIGGARGIGAAIVQRLSQDGAAVAYTWVTRATHASGLAIQADSADPLALAAAVDHAANTLGGLDILIYNAGILIPGDIASYKLADVDRMYAVNVRGPFAAVQAALAHLPAGGKIITVGSIASEAAHGPGSTVYGMTKAAVARMVRGLAWDLAPRGITINDVQPGPIATDMTPGSGELAERLRNASPQQRLGSAQEVADFVTWLALHAPDYIHGAGLKIDGGFTA